MKIFGVTILIFVLIFLLIVVINQDKDMGRLLRENAEFKEQIEQTNCQIILITKNQRIILRLLDDCRPKKFKEDNKQFSL